MPPGVAAVIFSLGILWLFLLGRDPKQQASSALWIPIAWISIAMSRTVGQWLGLAPIMEASDQLVEGSPFDRLVFAGLLLGGLMVLAARGQRTGMFLRANGPLLVFFLFAGVSFLWSEYPSVALKRWIKAFGNLVMVFVVVTEASPSAAVKLMFARISFLLLPLSILFIKYYPALGRNYHRWSGEAFYQGVATGKNGLGVLCLILGLATLWRLADLLSSDEHPGRTRLLAVYAFVLAMILWLFWMADSITSFVCFLIGCALFLVAGRPSTQMRPATLHILVAAFISLAGFALFFDPGGSMVSAVGRDTTLTGRRDLWADILSMDVNPVWGTGFESFWLGDRAAYFWENYWWKPNQAHNGYLEIFINLGWAGLALHAVVIAWAYKNIIQELRTFPELGRLRLTFFLVSMIYNLTEAAFRGNHAIWVVFLLAATVIPAHRSGPTSRSRSMRQSLGQERIFKESKGVADQWPSSQ